MTLRRRLVAAIALLVVAGIVTIDVVSASSLRSYLYGRLDEQLTVAQDQAYSYLVGTYLRDLEGGSELARTNPAAWLATIAGSPVASPGSPVAASAGVPLRIGGPGIGRAVPPLEGAVLSARISPDVYVEILGETGRVLYMRPSGSRDDEDPAPVLPRHLPVQSRPAPSRFGARHGAYVPAGRLFAVRGEGEGAPHYEGLAVALPGGTLLTMSALTPTNETIASLDHVEILVSVLVVLAMAGLGWWVTRRGLRPLEEMAATATAIAGGDLSRRVAHADSKSEVGRLGTALNAMLAQIESAFRARTASEARLRNFVADASHELRTPLTSIRGYAELLEKGALVDQKEQQDALERIEREAARMGSLVDDLLLLARLDEGRPLESRRLDLAALAADVVADAMVVAPERVQRFEAEGPVIVMGDEERLRQAIGNLVRNAHVHTPASAAIRVRVTGEDGLGKVEVEDEGPGLPPEIAERVFDRFFRGPAAPARQGSGLGLAIVAAIVEAHGGRARAAPRPGGGTTFVIEVPMAPKDAPGPTVEQDKATQTRVADAGEARDAGGTAALRR